MEIKTIIIDTNAYSEFKKGNPVAIEIIRRVSNIVLCPIVLGELIAGFVLGNKEAKNRNELRDFISSKRVIVIKLDNQTAEYFAQIFKTLKVNGTPLPTNDIWIAAISKQLEYPIFTFDNHFLQIENITAICKPADLLKDEAALRKKVKGKKGLH